MGIKSIRSIGCLALFVCLSYSMLANAQVESSGVIDTLTKRVINGLEVVPIRTSYDGIPFEWRLRVSDFDSYFQKFESKYPGCINYSLESKETATAMRDWRNHVWKNAVPNAIKKTLKKIDIRLFVDKEGNVFTAEFSMKDEVFQKLNTLPQNTLKNLYQNLIEEKCETIKDIEFHCLDLNSGYGRSTSYGVCGSLGLGKEYVTIDLSGFIYYIYGSHKSSVKNAKGIRARRIDRKWKELVPEIVVDTLSQRAVNGLEVIPIRTSHDGVPFRWELRAYDFDSYFQKFEGKYAGSVNNYRFIDLDTTAPMSVREWEVYVWESVVPDVIKALDGFGIRLFIDTQGRVFTVEFSMDNKVFQKLDTLPQNTLKKLYQALTKEECKAIKGAKIQRLDSEWDRFPSCSEGSEIEYITIFLGKTGIWRCDLP